MIRSSKRALLFSLGIWAVACARSVPSPVPSVPIPAAPRDTSIAPEAPADTGVAAGERLDTDVLGADSVQALTDADTVTAVGTVGAQRGIRVCAGGDVLLGNNLDTTWAARASGRIGRAVSSTPDPFPLLAPLLPLVADADIVLLNIEGAIGEGAASSKCQPGSRNCYAFRQPPGVAPALRQLAGDGELVGNVANNHAMDAGHLGFLATQEHLAQADVHVVGADTIATIVITPNGDSVAFLGFSTAQAGPDPRDLAAVRRHVMRAATDHALVVVTMHMGAEGVEAQRTPAVSEQYLGEDRGNAVAFARAAADAGASVVFGHGPHVMRAAEWYQESLVLYSLGNLLTYGPFSLVEPLNRGGMACVTLTREGHVQSAVLRSTLQEPPGIVQPDPTGRAAWLVDSLSQLDFPGSAARLYGEAVIRR